MDISVVIPLLNEEESLQELYDWIAKVMQSNHYLYEVIFIDDGSTDNSWSVIEKLSTKHTEVRGIRFQKNYGKSQALDAGFEMANGNVVITMDADLQDNPDEIPDLYDLIIKQNFDLISGWKKKRYDNVVTKNIPSKLFNAAARKTSGLKLNDFNCGLKAYKNEVVKAVKVSGEMHRYMHIFGLWGTVMFLFGITSAFYIGAFKLYNVFKGIKTILVTENPWFYIALTSMILGTLLFLAGFIGELIIKTKSNEKHYTIKEKLNF